MARKNGSSVAWPLIVYPLAAVGVLSLYLHYWGRKLGTS